jgi:hypothetical protein
MILPDIIMDAPWIYFGVPDFAWGEKIDAYYYRYVNDHGKYLDYAVHTEESKSAIHPTDVAHYEVKSNDYHEVGSNVTFKGKSWVVTCAQITYEQGMLSYQHVLVDRSAFQRKSKMNQRIQGVSLEGKVIRKANNMVHAMPEEGARIKVYFPNGTEKGAMAVNSTRGKHEEMKGRTVFQKPSTKVFHMPGAAKMELGEDGVLFEKNTVRMRLDQANILVESDGVLYVHAENTMEMGNSNSMPKRIRMSAVDYIQFQTQSAKSAMKIWGNQVGIQSDKVNFHKVEMSLLDMLNEEDLKEMYMDNEVCIEEMNLLSMKTYGFTHPGSISDKESAGIREGVRERVGKDPNASTKARARVKEWKPDLIEQRHKEYLYRTRKEEAQRAEQQSGTGTVALGAVAAQSQSSEHQKSVSSQGSASSYISSTVNKAGNYLGKLMDMSRAGIEGKSGLENLAGAILNDMQLQKELSAKPDYYTKQLDDGGKYYARYTFLQFKVAPLMFWSDLQIAAGLLGLVLAPFSLGGSLTLTVLAVADIGLSVADIAIASKKKNDLMKGELETDPTFLGMNQSVVNILGLVSFGATIGVSLWKAANVGADARRVQALVEMDRMQEEARRLEQAAIRKRVEGNIAESEAVREARKSSGWKDYVREEKKIWDRIEGTGDGRDWFPTRQIDPDAEGHIIQRVSEVKSRLSNGALNKSGSNFAYAEVDISGIKREFYAHSQVDGPPPPHQTEMNYDGFSFKPQGEIRYAAEDAPNSIGKLIPRNADTEHKIINNLANQLGEPNSTISGKIKLFTENDTCVSCNKNIRDFKKDYPGIIIEIIHNDGNKIPKK